MITHLLQAQNFETLCDQKTITALTLHVTLNVHLLTKTKQVLSVSSLVIIGHFKPLSSSDNTKINDRFYIEYKQQVSFIKLEHLS